MKIGHTTGHPGRRAEALEVGSPVPLESLGIVPGPADLERELHRRFAPLRRRGEWFALEGELLDFARGPEVLPWPGPPPTAGEVLASRAGAPDAPFSLLEAAAVLGLDPPRLRALMVRASAPLGPGRPIRLPAGEVAFLGELIREDEATRAFHERGAREAAARLAAMRAAGRSHLGRRRRA